MPNDTGTIGSIAAAGQGGNRGAELWGIDSGGLIWTSYQVTPGGAWSGWEGPGFKGQQVPVWQVAAAGQNNGELMLFALDRDGWVWSVAQYAPGGDWTGWSGPGLNGQPEQFVHIAAAQQAGSRGVELWAIDTDGQIWTCYQLTAGGAWSGWEGPGFKGQTVPMQRLAAADQGNGMVVLFALDQGGALWGISQYAAGGDWGGWSGPGFGGTGGPFTDITVVQGSGGGQLWATDANSEVWTLSQTSPGASWSAWSGPAFGGQSVPMKDIAAAGQNTGSVILFGLQPNGQLWSIGQGGGGWGSWTQQPGSPAAVTTGWDVAGANGAAVLSVGNALFAVDATTGNISQYAGTAGQWTQIGGPAHDYEGSEDALYRITADMSAVQQWDPVGLSWTPIGGAMAKLITSRHRLHGLDGAGNAFMYSGTPNQWTPIGGPFLDLDANEDYCFATAADGSSVSMAPCGTTAWTQIGGAMSGVYATGNAVYGVSSTGAVSLYTGVPMQWTAIGGPFLQLAVYGVRLFAIAADRSSVLEYRIDLSGEWQTIAAGADSIAAGSGYIAGVSGGSILTHVLGEMPDTASRQLRSMSAPTRNDPVTPPQNRYRWLFEFKTADQAFAGYEGWVQMVMEGRVQYKLGRTHFDRGAAYMVPLPEGQASVSRITYLVLQGEKHFLPDHWSLATIKAWDLTSGTYYLFDVNQDVPNELDRPGSLTVFPTSTGQTSSPPQPAYVYVWAADADTAVGHASLALSDGTTYISWWPSGENRKTLGWKGLAYDAPHNPAQSYEADVDVDSGEGKPPGLVLPIWNLDEDAVRSWWTPLDADPGNHWNLLTLNCSTVVFKALQTGGALAALTPGEFEEYCFNLPWTPNDVARLVLLLQSKHQG